MDELTYLFGLEKFGIKFGLDNIRALTNALGRPYEAYRSVLVAGTNGKGSTSAMVEMGLRVAGHRTGLYTSPHLVNLNERFVIAGRPVADADLKDSIGLVRSATERLMADGTLNTHPTFFEVTTAMAFDLFKRAGVEVAVLEVGLGGRFDATNVVQPIVGVISSIDLDHERYLGETIPEIAFEKAGIVKPGMVLVCNETKPEAVQVIAAACRDRGATLLMADDGVEARTDMRDGRVALSLTTARADYGEMALALRGRHQARNALTAVRVLEQLDGFGLSVPTAAIQAALTNVRWPGRLQLIELDDRRRLLLDSAHNPAGARVLAQYLEEIYPAGLALVFGAMKDKVSDQMLEALLPHATRLVVTEPKMARAADPADLARQARALAPHLTITVERDARAALDLAWVTDNTVCATGSIFLVGELLGSMPE